MSYVCQVSVIDSMQAPPQLFFLFALELPEVPSALCLEYMCVLSCWVTTSLSVKMRKQKEFTEGTIYKGVDSLRETIRGW